MQTEHFARYRPEESRFGNHKKKRQHGGQKCSWSIHRKMSRSPARFRPSVKEILYKRCGGKCSICRASTFGPHTSHEGKFQCIGEAAHITAASEGGPRYDKDISQAERTSVKNGIWVCRNCHKRIDNDTVEYTKEKLRSLKEKAEEHALALLSMPDITVVSRS